MAVVLGNTGVLQPGKWRWARALGWGAVLFLLLFIVYPMLDALVVGFEFALTHRPFDAEAIAAPPPALGFTPVVVGLAATLLVYWGAVRLIEKRPASEFALPRLMPEYAIGFGIGALLMTLTVGALWLFGWDRVTRAPVSAILSAINLTLQSSVLEETLMRLVVFRLVWRAAGIWPALAFSALLFGAMHLTNPHASWFAAICIAFEAGVLLAAFYVLTGRAWMSIGVHAGWNFTQGWIWGAAVSGTTGFGGGPFVTVPSPDVPDILAGAGFGPEATLAALVICTVAGVGVLWLGWRRGQFAPAD
jgi:uncharacterized protein